MFMLDRSMQNMEASSHCCILCIAILMGKAIQEVKSLISCMAFLIEIIILFIEKPYRRSSFDLLYGFPIRMAMHKMQQ